MEGEYQMWVQHFIDQAKGLVPHQKTFYKIGSQRGEGKNTIQLVTPTKQVVERAKSSLEELRKDTYDPITGVVHQSMSKLLRGNISPKKKKQSTQKLPSRIKKRATRSKKKRVPKKKTIKKIGHSKNRKNKDKPWLL